MIMFMQWHAFEILGAYRDSGEPARLFVEAAGEDDAIEYAAAQGVLVSRIVRRSSEAVASTPGSTGATDAAAHLRFGSRIIPDLDLLPHEIIVARYDARPSELGVVGIIFSHRRRLVLTDRRLIVYDRRLIDSRLDAVRLSRVSAVRLGVRIDPVRTVLGLLLGLMGSGVLTWLLLVSGLSIFGAGRQPATGQHLAALVYGIVLILAAVVTLIQARSRLIGVMVDGQFHGLLLRRFRAQRTGTFINALERMLHGSQDRDDRHRERTKNADAS